MTELFDENYFEIKMIIPIHDIENFDEIKLFQVEMTKLKIWSDELKERILGSFTDEPESKSAQSNQYGGEEYTFDSKTTLKKDLTFDNQAIETKLAQIKNETSGNTALIETENNDQNFNFLK